MNETFEAMALRVANTYFYPEMQVKGYHYVDFALRIRDELCKGQEPVAWLYKWDKGSDIWPYKLSGEELADFIPNPHTVEPLYTRPAPIPADMVLVPREPTVAMREVLQKKAVLTWSRTKGIWEAMIAAYEGEKK
jgi:hypothetical protein